MFSSFFLFSFIVYLEQFDEYDLIFPSDLTGVMDRLRHLDPRRRSSEQKMQQTTSVRSIDFLNLRKEKLFF